jgi:hypothetical protein
LNTNKIPKRSTNCDGCAAPFIPGSAYISILKSSEEGWERGDYCSKCWENEKEKNKGQFWRGKIPLKRDKKLSPDEKALDLFRETKDLKLLSVLALYLLRRDQIVKRGEAYYEIPETGEVIVVEKIYLSPQEGKDAGEQLVRLLGKPSK